jgi:transcriptional regulator with PAS, ATPase and Fis domain
MYHGISTGLAASGLSGGRLKTLEDMEKEHIKAVLRTQSGNKTRTADILGIDRKTLWAKIKRFKL